MTIIWAMRTTARIGNLFAWLALAAGILLWGADARGQSAEKAVSKVVRAIEARYRGAESFQAVFEERRSEGRGSVQIEAGTLYIRRPGLMRWEYEEPEKKLFLVDGKYAWFYVPADRTVTKAPVRDSDDERIPLLLLTGKASLGRACRRIELADVHVEAAGDTALRCLPARGAEDEYREAVFEVDAQDRLVRLLVREAGDVETEFHFGRWEENVPLAPSLFRFAPPKGTTIVDEQTLTGSPAEN
ncbi:MAG TPA: outer membrane lipoprotein chaperone LolA [Candidatus Acidoferrales bacterium]|nr:outer membrane lipoprotein chaperone LolA [Candidatus Acidoferrales bacterium]